MDNKGIVQVNYYKLSMPKIFISYRRADSQQTAERIYDNLTNEFDDVFLDVDDHIHSGADWEDVLKTKLHESDVLLVIIGEKWLTELLTRQNSTDYVRFEVQSGLNRGSSMQIIPVLVNGASNTVFRLPDDIHPTPEVKKLIGDLSRKQSHRVRGHPDFRNDIARLIKFIEPQQTKSQTAFNWRWLVGAVIVSLIAAVIAISPSFFNNNGDSTQEAQDIMTEDREFPCNGEIIISTGYGTSLNVVHALPGDNAPPREMVTQGESVDILSSQITFGARWYEIQYTDNGTIGWIREAYIEVFDNCP